MKIDQTVFHIQAFKEITTVIIIMVTIVIHTLLLYELCVAS